MLAIAPFVLKKPSIENSLRAQDSECSLGLKNTTAPGTITGVALTPRLLPPALP